MLEKKDRLNRFLQEIITEAEDKRNTILDELRVMREKELAQAGINAQKLRAETAAAEEKRIVAEQNAAVSREREKLRVSLSQKRSELANSVIELVKQRLLEFSRGDDYASFFTQLAGDLAGKFRGKPFVLYVKPEDTAMAQAILKETEGASAEADPSILLGGCRLKCGGVTADDTLDSRLEQQRARILAGISLPEL
jgi:vacuolar-type H+-ATPase subunit E/Vma4